MMQGTNSVDAYIVQFPPETQHLLEQLRALVLERVPEATEPIKYGRPTYTVQGKHA